MRKTLPTVVFLIMEGARRHVRGLERELRSLSLNYREWVVLMTLHDLGTVPQQVIRDLLGINKHAIVGLVDLLEAESLLVRKPDSADRRVQLLDLTTRGHDLVVRTLLELTERVDDRYLEALSDDERRRLRRILARVVYDVTAD